jgi:FkbM family methyltransferase
MKQIKGWWCPDYDDDLQNNIGPPEFAGRMTYQFDAFAYAFPRIKRFRHALDIGAHIGLWSHVLARCFTWVTAFEPVKTHADCFAANVLQGCDNVLLHEVALGEKDADVTMALKKPWSVKARIHTNEQLPTVSGKLMRLDSLWQLSDIDLIKIDCEGYELFTLRGGEEIIKRDKPFMIVEQKPPNTSRYGIPDKAGVDLLQSWGAKVLHERGGDYFMAWE